MLNLSTYSWVYKAKPPIPKLSLMPKPKGYKPPEPTDPHYDKETGGYRVGTVREWSEGDFMKMPNKRWYPYDKKTDKIYMAGGWIPHGQRALHRDLPQPATGTPARPSKPKAAPITDPKAHPELGQLLQRPKNIRPLDKQGGYGCTMLRTLADGTETVFKYDAYNETPVATKEAGAYLVAKHLGLDVVPPTALVKEAHWSKETHGKSRHSEEITDESLGSVQKKISGDVLLATNTKKIPSKIREENLHRMLAIRTLDYIIDNADRHDENIMVDNDGRYHAIDHGHAFFKGPFIELATDDLKGHLLDMFRDLGKKKVHASLGDLKNKIDKVDHKKLMEDISPLIGEEYAKHTSDNLTKLSGIFKKIIG